MKHFVYAIATALLAIMVQGCSKAEPPKQEGTASSIAGYNYTTEGIQEFFVNEAWSGGLGIGEGGGSIVCCVMLPDKWKEGLSATVSWRRSDCGGVDENGDSKCAKMEIGTWPKKTLKKEVPIELYSQPSRVQVMFLPNDEVKIYVSSLGPQHPDHPSKLGRARPLDHPEWKLPE